MFLLPWAHLCLQGHACSDKTVTNHKLGHPDLNSLSHRPSSLNLAHVPNPCFSLSLRPGPTHLVSENSRLVRLRTRLRLVL